MRREDWVTEPRLSGGGGGNHTPPLQRPSEIERRVRVVIEKFAEHGLRSLGVAFQV